MLVGVYPVTSVEWNSNAWNVGDLHALITFSCIEIDFIQLLIEFFHVCHLDGHFWERSCSSLPLERNFWKNVYFVSANYMKKVVKISARSRGVLNKSILWKANSQTKINIGNTKHSFYQFWYGRTNLLFFLKNGWFCVFFETISRAEDFIDVNNTFENLH